MKKLGILTYHSSINEGAMLQAYALQKICQEKFSHIRVEIINYESFSAQKRDFLNCFKTRKNFKSVLAYLMRFYRLSQFKKKYFSLGNKQLVSDDYEKSIQFLNQQNYDGIMVGSDEVWKIIQGKYTARKFPNIYWLDNKIKAKKFAYAASANKTNLETLDLETKKFLQNSFKSYSLIGVRDRITYKIVSNFTARSNNLFKVINPTLLLDSLDKKQLKKKLEAHNFDFNKKTLILNLNSSQIVRITTNFFRKHNWQVVSVTEYSSYADINFVGILDPLEWVSLIDHCHFYLTERFHGTIFSILSEIPFLAIEYQSKFTQTRSRKIQGLLEDLQLTENLFTYQPDFVKKDLEDKLEYVWNNTDFSHAKSVIETQRKSSLDYLQKIGEELCL